MCEEFEEILRFCEDTLRLVLLLVVVVVELVELVLVVDLVVVVEVVVFIDVVELLVLEGDKLERRVLCVKSDDDSEFSS